MLTAMVQTDTLSLTHYLGSSVGTAFFIHMKVRNKNNGQFKNDAIRPTIKDCAICGNSFYCRSQFKFDTSRYCSRKCLGQANKKRLTGKAPYKMTDKTRIAISKAKTGVSVWGGHRENMDWVMGEKNFNWMGDKVGYDALHDWIIRQKGKAEICMFCQGINSVEWANYSGEYKRDTNDYLELCKKCHAGWDALARKGELWA